MLSRQNASDERLAMGLKSTGRYNLADLDKGVPAHPLAVTKGTRDGPSWLDIGGGHK